MPTFSIHSISAMVLASLMVLWITLGERLSFLAASLRKSFVCVSKGMSLSMCLEVICELEKICGRKPDHEIPAPTLHAGMTVELANLFCWIFRALRTFFLIVSELS
jgi:hypothetical protein